MLVSRTHEPRVTSDGDAHRSDIDGLRAVAVLSVVVFHLHAQALPGGFIGVDVFFVISGYLLAGIIAKEIETSRFSIASFYERRARRILPALIALLIPITLLSALFLFPKESLSYAQSLLSAVFSYSNFYFLVTADYFGPAAQSEPLLHTWSLAVEEQFYVVLPLLLWLLAKSGRQVRNAVILLITAGSFALSVWLSYKEPTSAFYLPTSRAWELLFGAILALDVLPAVTIRWHREIVAASGLLLIVYSACRLTESSPFPGIAALMPCGGALLILLAGRRGRSTIGNLLSLAPLTFLGLISYSVYLWHWPLIVFSRMGFLPIPVHGLYYPVMIALSILVGTLSWRYVEKPFRTGAFRASPRATVFLASASGIGLCAIMAVIIIRNDGFRSRFPPAAVNIADFMYAPSRSQIGTCFITSRYRFSDFRKDLCMQPENGKTNYLLAGDSHSAVLWYGLSQSIPHSRVLQASVSGCNVGINVSGNEDCRKMDSYIFGSFLPSHKVAAVFFSARWRHELDFAKLADTIAWCSRHKIVVYILGPVMEYNAPLPRLLAYSIAFHDPALVQRSAETEMLALDESFRRRAVEQWHVHYISLMNAQCPSAQCRTYADNSHTTPMLFDDNHLSNEGSRFVIERLIASRELPVVFASAGNSRKLPDTADRRRHRSTVETNERRRVEPIGRNDGSG